MKTFEEALDDIYDRAKARQNIERRRGRNKRLIPLDTTCVILSMVLVLFVVFVWWSNDSQNDTVVLEGKNGDKKWISDIPGAVYIENPEYFDGEDKRPAAPPLREDTIEFLKKSLVVIGDVENVKSFYIKEGNYTWYITTFDLKISMDVHGAFETDTLKCVTSFKYLYDGTPSIRCGLSDIGKEIIEDPSGAFVVKDVLDDSWHWSGVYYNVSDYADYYVTRRYNYSTKGVLDRRGKLMTFDEIKNDSVLFS